MVSLFVVERVTVEDDEDDDEWDTVVDRDADATELGETLPVRLGEGLKETDVVTEPEEEADKLTVVVLLLLNEVDCETLLGSELETLFVTL